MTSARISSAEGHEQVTYSETPSVPAGGTPADDDLLTLIKGKSYTYTCVKEDSPSTLKGAVSCH
jgi:hypothetical protein